MRYLGIFRPEFKKNYSLIWNQHPQICHNVKFRVKKRLFVLDEKYLIWVVLDHNFKKTIVMFEISNFEFVNMQSFMLNKKNWICNQNCLIWVFLTVIWKTYSHV